MRRLALLIPGLLLPASAGNADEADAPLPPAEAAQTMRVPEGFRVTLFAGEPDVMQPIGFCIDDRSRLWVAEAYNYPQKGKDHGDRIIIFADRDGDGTHDQRTVFYDGLSYVTGIEVGFGGAWVMSPPHLYFIPDRDGDDLPDGPPEVVLDGFGIHANAHNLANGLAWGPDGWLYGTHGRTNWSMLGKPGDSDTERVRFDGGVYRFHPIRRVWEAYADGTTNPWGIDWNDYGHAFVCNCVNPHVFQVIQGAHYEPWRGRESSQYAYQRIPTIADHLHFVGLSSVQGGLGTQAEDTAGGGHAHCGTMIYLGDSFPTQYRNTLFTNNIHGRRINNDLLTRRGSGYVASHGPDLLRSQDPWFMGVTLAYGPAGEVYVSDWSDTGECHSTRNTRRHTGRIYRMTYGKTDAPTVDVSTASNAELVQLQHHRNDWFVRHARRVLHERTAAGQDMSSARAELRAMFDRESDITRKLRAMWALHAIDELDEALLTEWLGHPDEHIRAWSVTFLCENGAPTDDVLKRFERLASTGDSSLVRLSLASGLQRLGLRNRWNLAEALAVRGGDAADLNLPLMIWYGCEPLINNDLQRFAHLGATAAISQVRVNIARRIASSTQRNAGLELLAGHLADATNDEVREDLLEGILQGVSGQRAIPTAVAWHNAYVQLSGSPAAGVRDRAVRLAVVFNDEVAMKTLRELAMDDDEPVPDRVRAINALVAKPLPGFDRDLIRLLRDASIRSSVLKGLAAYDHPETASAILKHYASLNARDKQDALMALASRAAWTRELLRAMEDKQVNADSLTAYAARQMRALGDDTINSALTRLWGEVHETPQNRQKQITRMKDWLTPDLLGHGNTERGAQLFRKQCAACHRFFGEGGMIGPDITGAQRMNLDYLLENIIAPSASVSNDYQMEIVLTDNGRVLTGLVEPGANGSLIIQTVNDRIAVPREEIEERTKSRVSLMPQGLLDTLSDDEIRDLIAYLQRRQ